MSILIDQNEPEEFGWLDESGGQHGLLPSMGINIRRGPYNKTEADGPSFPDFQVLNGSYTGVNRKQAVEAMADLDKVEDQLRRELRVCENLVFVWEGALTWAEEGTYAGDAEYLRVKRQSGRQGSEYDTLQSRGRVLHQAFARWAKFQWALQDAGVAVVGTGNIRGTAAFLHSLHEGHENRLFRRLVRVRQDILEDDPKLRIWKLFLMGMPGVGPEVATALTDQFRDMSEMLEYMHQEGPLAPLVLPTGRKLGPALARRISQFLGVTEVTR